MSWPNRDDVTFWNKLDFGCENVRSKRRSRKYYRCVLGRALNHISMSGDLDFQKSLAVVEENHSSFLIRKLFLHCSTSHHAKRTISSALFSAFFRLKKEMSDPLIQIWTSLFFSPWMVEEGKSRHFLSVAINIILLKLTYFVEGRIETHREIETETE